VRQTTSQTDGQVKEAVSERVREARDQRQQPLCPEWTKCSRFKIQDDFINPEGN